MYERIYCKEQLDAIPGDDMLGEVSVKWSSSHYLEARMSIFRKSSVTEATLLRRLDIKLTSYLVIPKKMTYDYV